MIKNNRKKSRLKWVLIFSPIIVMAIVIGVFYAVVLSGLGTNDNNPKKQLVNSVIKDAILNPTELGETIDSLSITNEEDTSGASTDSTSQKKDDSSITKSGVISEIKDTDTNRTIINTVITNMVMIGLLCENRGELIITNNGKQAYIDQTYHMEAASLYEAKESRRLSLIAVVISIVSILFAVIPSI